MPECEKCGRKFKNAQALGGHKSNAHPETVGNAQAPPRSQAEAAGPQPGPGVDGQGPPQPREPAAPSAGQVANVDAGPGTSPGLQPQQPSPEGTKAVAQTEPGAKGESSPAPPTSTQAPSATDGTAAQPQQPEKLAQTQPTAETNGVPEAPPAGSPRKGEEKAVGSPAPAPGSAQAQLPPPAGSPIQVKKPQTDDASQAEQIRYYLEVGYTLEQLMKSPFNFKETTVRQEVAKLIPAEGEKPGGPTRMPMVLKAGAGQELISPEAIIQNYLVPEGDIGVGMLRGFMLYRAAQLAVMTDVEIMKGQSDAQAKALKPIMDIMEQARVDMDAAAQRAKDSNTEIAEMAAAGAAVRAAAHIDARFEEMKAQKPDIASTPDPIKGMMARTMETIMAQVMGALMPGSQTGATPGFVDKRGQGGK